MTHNVLEEHIKKDDLSDFIHYGDMFREHDKVTGQKEEQGRHTSYKAQIPQSIRVYAKEIDDALENILVCDPAIGSGAFPVGMMNEIVRARLNLLEAGYIKDKRIRNAYTYKRQAIQKSIYGVDIDSGAVEIAKLRFWLSLVVDENSIDDIKPLPNLDYKIMCANSLVSIDSSLFNKDMLDELKNYKSEFYNETRNANKRKLKRKIDDILKEFTKEGDFDYRIFFSEVFHQNKGFDIVIGNPPYVGEKGHKDLFEPIKKCSLGRFYQGKMDYFYFFFHLALDLLREDGISSFITTNYYITATGGVKLRKDLKERSNIIHLINFNELKIFKSATGQHNMITMIQKRSRFSNQEDCQCSITSKTGFASPRDLQDIVLGNNTDTVYQKVPQKDLYDGINHYIRLEKEDENNHITNILNKIQNGNECLGDICNVNQGIVSGADKVSERHITKFGVQAQKDDGIFVLNTNNPNDISLINKIHDQELSNLIVPFFKNSNVHRYTTETRNDSYILYLKKNMVNISDYPDVEEHIKKFKKIIDISSDNSPYLNRPRKLSIFKGPKIVAPQRSSTNTFGYNETDWFASSDVYFITNPKRGFSLKYIIF